MATGSGLCSQYGFKAEVTPGTAVTVDHFLKHTTVGGGGLQLLTVTDTGLGGCALVPTVDRTVSVGRQVRREVEHNVGSRGFGQIFRQMLGTTSGPTVVSGDLYRQIHTNGDLAGDSLTVQFGFPETTATGAVRPITVNGAKITQWEFSQLRNELLKLRYTLDGWDEVTNIALASATYPTGSGATSNEPFRFNCLSAKIGGTASISSGLVSIADGVEIAGLRGVTSKGVQPLATDRFFSGGAGVKSEQLLSGGEFQDFLTDLDVEYQSRAQLYDIMSAYTTVPLELSWVGKIDIGSGTFNKLSIIYPQSKVPTSAIDITGPGALDNKTTLKAYGDPAGLLPAIQIVVENLETSL